MDRNTNNEWRVETSELFRVYPPQSPQATPQEQVVSRDATPDWSSLETENTLLKQNIETLEASLKRSDVAIDDLRRRLDNSETERRETAKAYQLLIHQPVTQPTQPEKRTNWLIVVSTTLITGLVIALVYAIRTYLVNLN